MRVPASGGTPESLTTVNKDKGEVRHLRPQFLPGTGQLLFTVAYASADPQFAVLDLKKKDYRTVARSGDNGRYTESGHLLSMRAGTLFALPFDLDRLTAIGPEAPVIEGVSTVWSRRHTDYAISQAGLLVYCENASLGGTTLTWRDRHGVKCPFPVRCRARGARAASTGWAPRGERDPGKGLGYLGRGPRARHTDASHVRRDERRSHLDAGRTHHRVQWEQGRQTRTLQGAGRLARPAPTDPGDDRSGAVLVDPGRQTLLFSQRGPSGLLGSWCSP